MAISRQVQVYMSFSPPPLAFWYTPSSRQWELVGVADSSRLGTPERTRELEKRQQRSIEHGMTIAANL